MNALKFSRVAAFLFSYVFECFPPATSSIWYDLARDGSGKNVSSAGQTGRWPVHVARSVSQ